MEGKPGNHGNKALRLGVNSYNKAFSVPVGTGKLLFVMVLMTPEGRRKSQLAIFSCLRNR